MHRARVIVEALIVTLADAWFVWFFRRDLGWAFPVAIVLLVIAWWILGKLEEREKQRAREANEPADVPALLRAVRGATGPIGDVVTTISGTAKVEFPGLDLNAKGVVGKPGVAGAKSPDELPKWITAKKMRNSGLIAGPGQVESDDLDNSGTIQMEPPDTREEK